MVGKEGTGWTPRALVSGLLASVTALRRAGPVPAGFSDARYEPAWSNPSVAAASLVHDLRNTVQALHLYLGLLETAPDASPQSRSSLVHVLAAADQLSDRLESCAPGSDHQTPQQTFSPAGTIARAEWLLRGMCAPGCLVVDIDDRSDQETRGNAAEYIDVLGNLVVNARQALAPGGTVTLTCARGDNDEAVPLRLPGAPHVVVRVSDPGVGMDAVTLKRVCEAGFTTRRGSGGSGLGLASAKRFARDCGGVLHLASAPGRGTTVSLWLPVVSGVRPAAVS